MSKKGGQERMAMADTYETFRQSSIEGNWQAGQCSRDLAAERLYERVLFHLINQPDVELAQRTRDPEMRAWYTTIMHE